MDDAALAAVCGSMPRLRELVLEKTGMPCYAMLCYAVLCCAMLVLEKTGVAYSAGSHGAGGDGHGTLSAAQA